MYEVYIVFRSITFAQRGQGSLNRRGIVAHLGRSPGKLAKNGCAYALRLRLSDAKRAVRTLEQDGIPYSAVYQKYGGAYEALSV